MNFNRFGEHTKVEAPEDPGLTTAQKWRDTIKKMLPAKKGSKSSGDLKMEEEEIVQIDCSAKDDQNRKILIHQDNDNRPQRAILRTKVEEVEQVKHFELIMKKNLKNTYHYI